MQGCCAGGPALSWPLGQGGPRAAATFDVTVANPAPAANPSAALQLSDLCQQNISVLSDTGALYYRQPDNSCMCANSPTYPIRVCTFKPLLG